MLKKLLRAILALLGALIGYGVYRLSMFLLEHFDVEFVNKMTTTHEIVAMTVTALLFGFIFFRLTPLFTRQGHKVADNIQSDLQGVSGNDMLTGVVGLIIGLVIAFLLSQIYEAIDNRYIYTVATVITYLIMGFLGVVIATQKGKEIFAQILSQNKDQSDGQSQGFGSRFAKGVGRSKKNANQTPKILDTSVIIDGRISEIMKTGFLEGPIVIPEFVLVELRHIADSADDLKRARGRRGLDVLKKIQNDYGIEIYNTEGEKALKEIPEVDVKLLKLAQMTNGKVVTNDFNLNKVAAINGVEVLNINDLANTLKPVVIPGEKMTVMPVKQGKDPNQSIAYLDDGTMVVVEDGRKHIGQSCEITVTSVLQTSAGRMIFGRIKVNQN